MSPEQNWVKWVVIGMTAAQTIATMLQVVGGKKNNQERLPAPVGRPIRLGLASLVLELVAWLVHKLVRAPSPEDAKQLSLFLFGPVVVLAGWSTIACLRSLLSKKKDREVIQVGSHDSQFQLILTHHTGMETFAWLLGSLAGVAIVATSLHFGGAIDLNSIMKK